MRIAAALAVLAALHACGAPASPPPPPQSSEWILLNVLAERSGVAQEFRPADVGDQVLIRLSDIVEVRTYDSEFAHVSVDSPARRGQIVVAAPIALFVDVLHPVVPLPMDPSDSD